MALQFVGTAHPPADTHRKHPADFVAAELEAANPGRRWLERHTTPILVEHVGEPVGEVLTSYQGPSGSMRVLGTIYDDHAKRLVKDGEMLGLSLGTDLVHREGEEHDPMVRTVTELSICKEPRRRGCYISEVDGVRYNSASYAASNGASLAPLTRCYTPPHAPKRYRTLLNAPTRVSSDRSVSASATEQ